MRFLPVAIRDTVESHQVTTAMHIIYGAGITGGRIKYFRSYGVPCFCTFGKGVLGDISEVTFFDKFLKTVRILSLICIKSIYASGRDFHSERLPGLE
jgi:hypothetical protein